MPSTKLALVGTAFAIAITCAGPLARAEGPPLAKKPPPYSLAWQLRPAAAGNVVRSDTTVAMFKGADQDGVTVASTLLASYKLTPELALLGRLAIVRNAPPMGESASSVSNPLLGVIWAPPLLAAPWKLAFFGAVTVPVGSGGGDSADAAMKAANASAMAARSSMDNALFAVNDTAAIAGADLAYVKNGLTLQLEATFFELFRVRGGPDATKTNFTSGFHAGYFVMPWLSIGGELRYQRYLSTPAFVKADTTGANRDNASAALGLRAHIPLGDGQWLRPGIAYARGLDDPMSKNGYHVVQVDVPFAF